MSSTKKTRTIRLKDYRVEFCVMPQDQGQIVEYSYALLPDGCGSGEIIRRRHDRSDGSVSYDIADLIETDEPQEWMPWNGVLPPHGTFEGCDDIGIKVI